MKNRAKNRADMIDVEEMEAPLVTAGASRILTEGLHKDWADSVKEYHTNSISAGAKQIDYFVGPRQISITDNGVGMTKEEIRNKFLPICKPSENLIASEIGKFGIGAKSAASFAKKMTVYTKSKGNQELKIVFDPLEFNGDKFDVGTSTSNKIIGESGTSIILEGFKAGIHADELRSFVRFLTEEVFFFKIGGQIKFKHNIKFSESDIVKNGPLLGIDKNGFIEPFSWGGIGEQVFFDTIWMRDLCDGDGFIDASNDLAFSYTAPNGEKKTTNVIRGIKIPKGEKVFIRLQVADKKNKAKTEKEQVTIFTVCGSRVYDKVYQTFLTKSLAKSLIKLAIICEGPTFKEMETQNKVSLKKNDTNAIYQEMLRFLNQLQHRAYDVIYHECTRGNIDKSNAFNKECLGDLSKLIDFVMKDANIHLEKKKRIVVIKPKDDENDVEIIVGPKEKKKKRLKINNTWGRGSIKLETICVENPDQRVYFSPETNIAKLVSNHSWYLRTVKSENPKARKREEIRYAFEAIASDLARMKAKETGFTFEECLEEIYISAAKVW